MDVTPSRAFRRLTTLAAVLTYLLIVVGGIVRVTGSGLGCGERDQWPFCHGQLLPPLERTALIEFGHRWIAFLATLAVLVLAAWVWIAYRRVRGLLTAATAVLVLFILQIVLGAITVLANLPNGVVMLHLANALLLLGALVWIAVAVNTAGSGRLRPSGGLRLGVVAAAATYVLALSGAFVVDRGAGYACAGWPLCGNGFQLSSGQLNDVNLLHRLVAGVVVLLLGYAAVRLRRLRPGDRALRTGAMLINVLILAQVAAGALVVELRLPAGIRGLHLALASALWATVVATVVLARGQSAGAPATTAARGSVRVGVAPS